MRNKPLTVADLIFLLSEYPDDAPVFDGRGRSLHATSVTEMTYDDWERAEATPDGEVPARGVGVSIGPRS